MLIPYFSRLHGRNELLLLNGTYKFSFFSSSLVFSIQQCKSLFMQTGQIHPANRIVCDQGEKRILHKFSQNPGFCCKQSINVQVWLLCEKEKKRTNFIDRYFLNKVLWSVAFVFIKTGLSVCLLTFAVSILVFL